MRKFILVMVLALLMAGCSSTTAPPEPVVEMTVWEGTEVSDRQADLYQSVTVAIGKVNNEKKTTVATVTMPDLEKYLVGDGDYDGSICEIEIEFPVEQVDGEWQIKSLDPLTDYIRSEAEQILIDKIESMGGIEIDFNPQEVPEE